jgi:phage-related protein
VSTTLVIFYKEEDGSVPVLEWLDKLPDKAQDKCRVRIERLADLGHELRRPEADFLRDKIYELRVSLQGVQYRILYFFYSNISVVISHGIIKEREVPSKEIDRAIERRKRFEENPEAHTYKEQEQ